METVLCNADKSTFWSNYSWKQFVELPDKDNCIVILPIVGFADWGLGHGLDAEETLLTEVLKRSVEKKKEALDFRVTPPLRFALGPYVHNFFGVDPDLGHAMVEEIIGCIKIAGFKKVVLFNSSPWNEEFIDVIGRDVRISHQLSLFCVNLAGLGFDLHPERSKVRREVQTVLTYLTGESPEPVEAVSSQCLDAPLSPGNCSEMLPVMEEALGLEEAAELAEVLLEKAARQLSVLFDEILAHPLLPNGGKIPLKN